MSEWRRPVGHAAALALLVLGCGMAFGVHLEAVVAVAALAAAVVVVVTAGWVALRHTLLARRLRQAARGRDVDGVPVEAVPGLAPLVAGLVRPRLFGCEELFHDLPAGQRRAVLLHEQAHRHHHDPRRLVVLEAIRRSFGWMPVIADMERSARARLEIRADRYALERGASRHDLAGAMLHLADGGTATTPAFGAATDQRLLALLGEDPSLHRIEGPWWLLVGAAVVAGAVCTTLLSGSHPEFMWIVRCLGSGCGGTG